MRAASGLRLRPPDCAATYDFVLLKHNLSLGLLIKKYFVDWVLELFCESFRFSTHTPTHAIEFIVDALTRCYLSVACARVSLCYKGIILLRDFISA